MHRKRSLSEGIVDPVITVIVFFLLKKKVKKERNGNFAVINVVWGRTRLIKSNDFANNNLFNEIYD